MRIRSGAADPGRRHRAARRPRPSARPRVARERVAIRHAAGLRVRHGPRVDRVGGRSCRARSDVRVAGVARRVRPDEGRSGALERARGAPGHADAWSPPARTRAPGGWSTPASWRPCPRARARSAGRGATTDTAASLDAPRAERLRAVLDVVDPEPLPPDHPLGRPGPDPHAARRGRHAGRRAARGRWPASSSAATGGGRAAGERRGRGVFDTPQGVSWCRMARTEHRHRRRPRPSGDASVPPALASRGR